MTKVTKKTIISYLLFIGGGALAGYIMYTIIGCPDGTCPLRSSSLNSVLYGMGCGLLLGIVNNIDF